MDSDIWRKWILVAYFVRMCSVKVCHVVCSVFVMVGYLSGISFGRAIAEAVANIKPRIPPTNLYEDSLLLSGEFLFCFVLLDVKFWNHYNSSILAAIGLS